MSIGLVFLTQLCSGKLLRAGLTSTPGLEYWKERLQVPSSHTHLAEGLLIQGLCEEPTQKFQLALV